MFGKKLRAALYARVSTDHQAKQQTIASQVEALEKRLSQDGLSLDAELRFIDDGYSGTTLVRPALERLRDQVAAGVVDRLYVHSPDRLARRYAYQVVLLEEFQRAGVDVVFLNHEHECAQTPEAELLLQVQGVIAEYERAKILERARRGKRQKAQSGSVGVFSNPPYGYRYLNKYQSAGQARLEVLAEEAAVVRQIFTWFVRDRLVLHAICRRLQAEGIRTRKGLKCWSHSTVAAILGNPAYQGLARYGKTKEGPRQPRLRPRRGQAEQPRRSVSIYRTAADEQIVVPVPALIDEELFAAAQEQLRDNARRRREGPLGPRHLLQGLVVCQQCGYACCYCRHFRPGRGAHEPGYCYYRCSGLDTFRHDGQRACTNPSVRADLLEQAVWSDVMALLTDPDRLEQEYRRRLSHQERGSVRASEQVLHLQERVRRSISRLIDAYQEGLVDKEEFEPRLRQARERWQHLQAEATATVQHEQEQQHLGLLLGQLQDFARQVGQGLDQADFATRRRIISLLIKRIEVNGAEVRIVYKIGPLRPASAEASDNLQDCTRRQDAISLFGTQGGGQPEYA